jgi:hypothetical protein
MNDVIREREREVISDLHITLQHRSFCFDNVKADNIVAVGIIVDDIVVIIIES